MGSWRTAISTDEAADLGFRPIPHEDTGRVTRGDVVITQGGAFGWFVGAFSAEGGVAFEWLSYDTREEFEKACATFDRLAFLSKPAPTRNVKDVRVRKVGDTYAVWDGGWEIFTSLCRLKRAQAQRASHTRWSRVMAREWAPPCPHYGAATRERMVRFCVKKATRHRHKAQVYSRALALITHSVVEETPT